MADSVNLRMEIKGVPELLRKLRDLKVDFEEAVSASMLAAAFVVSNDAKRRAPRKTGNLARSITPGVGIDPKGSTGPIINTAGALPVQSVDSIKADLKQDGNATAYIATNVAYAARMEYGFSDADSLGRVYNQPEHPYMRPALDENREKVIDTYAKALKQVIQKAGR